MNIFISTYHIVRDIFSFPLKIVAQSKKKQIQKELLEEQEKRQKQLLQETIGTISSTSKAEELLTDKTQDKKDLVTFNYQVKNDMGKIIKSSFDAKSISEV